MISGLLWLGICNLATLYVYTPTVDVVAAVTTSKSTGGSWSLFRKTKNIAKDIVVNTVSSDEKRFDLNGAILEFFKVHTWKLPSFLKPASWTENPPSAWMKTPKTRRKLQVLHRLAAETKAAVAAAE